VGGQRIGESFEPTTAAKAMAMAARTAKQARSVVSLWPVTDLRRDAVSPGSRVVMPITGRREDHDGRNRGVASHPSSRNPVAPIQ
jgi:hypothetical protein